MLQHKHHRFVDKLVHTCFIQGNPQLGLFMFDITERNTHRERMRMHPLVGVRVYVCVCVYVIHKYPGTLAFFHLSLAASPREISRPALFPNLSHHTVSLYLLYNGVYRIRVSVELNICAQHQNHILLVY